MGQKKKRYFKKAFSVERGIRGLEKKMESGFSELAEAISKLAHMMHDGFRRVDERFERVDERFERVDQRLEHIDARLDRIQDDVSDLPAIRGELRDLDERVVRLERKVAVR